ncbi:MAG: hypothetical protein ABGX27_09305 [Desulfurobacteriaceae bacterium]
MFLNIDTKEKEEFILYPPENIEEGDVFEFPLENLPLLVVIVNIEGSYAEVVPMSFQWELATRYDLIVDFEHYLRDKWIVEVDMTTTVPLSILFQAQKIGKLKEEDFNIVKDAVLEGVPLPRERSGRGYEDEIHSKFKDIEAERISFLVNSLLEDISSEDESFRVISFTPSFKEALEEDINQALAASGSSTVQDTEFGKILFNEEEKSIYLYFNEKFLKKNGTIYVNLKSQKFPIYKGTLEDIKIPNVTKEIFEVMKKAEVVLE